MRYGLHLAVAIIACGCIGLAEAMVSNTGLQAGGSYAGWIAIAFLGLLACGYVGRVAKFLLETVLPVHLKCPNCDYDLTLLDGQLKPEDKCPGCDAKLA